MQISVWIGQPRHQLTARQDAPEQLTTLENYHVLLEARIYMVLALIAFIIFWNIVWNPCNVEGHLAPSQSVQPFFVWLNVERKHVGGTRPVVHTYSRPYYNYCCPKRDAFMNAIFIVRGGNLDIFRRIRSV